MRKVFILSYKDVTECIPRERETFFSYLSIEVEGIYQDRIGQGCVGGGGKSVLIPHSEQLRQTFLIALLLYLIVIDDCNILLDCVITRQYIHWPRGFHRHSCDTKITESCRIIIKQSRKMDWLNAVGLSSIFLCAAVYWAGAI